MTAAGYQSLDVGGRCTDGERGRGSEGIKACTIIQDIMFISR